MHSISIAENKRSFDNHLICRFSLAKLTVLNIADSYLYRGDEGALGGKGDLIEAAV